MLIITDDQIAQMQRHGEAGYPHEVCGLLVGRTTADGARIVEQIRATANLNTERAHDRYILDPQQYLQIETDAAAQGLEVIGVYHTHPDHPSRPSETDRARAEEVWGNVDAESWSYVILQIAKGRAGTWNSWVLRNAAFAEERCIAPERVTE
ncbi:MAG: Mov34/MPN/PAD-1 family protein [Planctomycetota bacterium]